MTSFLVPFPFTDQRTTKQRPAVVVSSKHYNENRRDVLVMAITSQIRTAAPSGDVVIEDWQEAGRIRPSALKPLIATIDQGIIRRKLGRLRQGDRQALRQLLRAMFG